MASWYTFSKSFFSFYCYTILIMLFYLFCFFTQPNSDMSFFICHTNSKKQVMFSDGLVLDFLIFIINWKNQLCQGWWDFAKACSGNAYSKRTHSSVYPFYYRAHLYHSAFVLLMLVTRRTHRRLEKIKRRFPGLMHIYLWTNRTLLFQKVLIVMQSKSRESFSMFSHNSSYN